MADPDKGGAPFETIRDDECPAELRGSIFDERPVIKWYRIHDFQDVSLKLLAEQLLLGCPNFHHLSSVPLYITGELTRKRWAFQPELTVYCSPYNPGALEALTAIRMQLDAALDPSSATSELRTQAQSPSQPSAERKQSRPWQLAVARSARSARSARLARSARSARSALAVIKEPPQLGLECSSTAPAVLLKAAANSKERSSKVPTSSKEPSRLLLFLSKKSFVGEMGDALAAEVRQARAVGLPIVMLHATPDYVDGCDFGHFFSSTPQDLIHDGLYAALAMALYPSPFLHVSACLTARALGAIDLNHPKHATKRRSMAMIRPRALVRKQPKALPVQTAADVQLVRNTDATLAPGPSTTRPKSSSNKEMSCHRC